MSADILALLKYIQWDSDGFCIYCKENGHCIPVRKKAHKQSCIIAPAIAELEAQGQAIKVEAYRVLAGMGLV